MTEDELRGEERALMSQLQMLASEAATLEATRKIVLSRMAEKGRRLEAVRDDIQFLEPSPSS